jgi:hypothetical protein
MRKADDDVDKVQILTYLKNKRYKIININAIMHRQFYKRMCGNVSRDGAIGIETG